MGRKGWRRQTLKVPRRRPLRHLDLRVESIPPPAPPLTSPQNYLLGKIGASEFMQALYETGTVFMQRIAVYKRFEDNVRGDKDEGLAMRFDARNPSLRVFATIGEKVIPLGTASLVVHSAERDHGAYCLYAFPVPNERGPATFDISPIAGDPRLRKFGNTLVMFRDTREFARRLQRAAQEAGYDVEGYPVEYVPRAYCGDMGSFRKLERYSYQSEFRFVTGTPIPKDSLTLTLGSLRDIAIPIDLDKVSLLSG